LGPVAIGRVEQGVLQDRQDVTLCHRDGSTEQAEVTALFEYEGLQREETDAAGPGQIVAIAGVEGIGLGESISHPEHPEPMTPLDVDPPTMSMEFRINDGPFSGQEGEFVTSRQLRDRLFDEARNNLAIRVASTGAASCRWPFSLSRCGARATSSAWGCRR